MYKLNKDNRSMTLTALWRTSIGLFVFAVGISSGCAISKSPAPAEPETESSASQVPEGQPGAKAPAAPDGANPATIPPAIEEKDPKLTAAQILAQTNVTPRQGFDENEVAGDVGKSDLLGWQHRVYGIDLIDKGKWELARKHLQWASEMMNSPAAAIEILEQMEADPVAYLGADSESYQVQKGDTLGEIAGRYLNDSLKFPILARYNAIVVPEALEPGTVIQIPTGFKRKDAATAGRVDSNTVLTKPDPSQPDAGSDEPSAPASEAAVDTDTQPGIPENAPQPAQQSAPQPAQQPQDQQPESAASEAQGVEVGDGANTMTESIKALYSRVTFHYERGEFEQANSLNNQILDTNPTYLPSVLMKQRIDQAQK